MRGIARVWRTKFDDAKFLVDYAIEPPVFWWHEAQDIQALVDMPLEDMKAVASALSEDEWTQVEVALSWVRAIHVRRVMKQEAEPGDYDVADDDLEAMRDAAMTFGSASAALEALASRPTRRPVRKAKK